MSSEPNRLDDKPPKGLIFRHVSCERLVLLTWITHERGKALDRHTEEFLTSQRIVAEAAQHTTGDQI